MYCPMPLVINFIMLLVITHHTAPLGVRKNIYGRHLRHRSDKNFLETATQHTHERCGYRR